MRGSVTQALDTATVAALARMPTSTLDYWVRTGLVRPSVRGSSGRRVPRLWSIRDATVVRSLKWLRDAGCSLHRLRRARRIIEKTWNERPEDAVLYWDGNDVLALMPHGELVSVLESSGQLALHVVAVPLGAWAHDAEAVLRKTTASPSHPGRRDAVSGSIPLDVPEGGDAGALRRRHR